VNRATSDQSFALFSSCGGVFSLVAWESSGVLTFPDINVVPLYAIALLGGGNVGSCAAFSMDDDNVVVAQSP